MGDEEIFDARPITMPLCNLDYRGAARRLALSVEPVKQGLEAGNLGKTICHSGILSCFFQGFSWTLFFSVRSAFTSRRRVPCGMMTSSI